MRAHYKALPKNPNPNPQTATLLLPIMSSILPILREAAPRLTKHLFQSTHHRYSARGSALLTMRSQLCPRAAPRAVRSFKSAQWKHLEVSASSDVSGPRISAIRSSLKESASHYGSEARKRVFPQVSEKVVAYWLLGSAASVFGIVVFGGLTRLTESGYACVALCEDKILMEYSLSITEWKPVTGSLPPMNVEDWKMEYDLYRASPEFQRLNPHMTISEFKSIYYMEWTHRLWGRLVGLSFVVPAVYFIATRKVSARMARRISGIGALIGFQGVLGWWMVKSGLKDDLFAPGSHPRVSQYRLVAHLGTAFICYSAMLWNGLSILRTHKLLGNLPAAQTILGRLQNPRLRIFRISVGLLATLVFTTAMSGGLVAGLDAGLIYNEFPYMGVGLTPPKSELFSDFYSHIADGSDIWWRNPLENPSLVQLDHRILATTTFTSIMALWGYSRFAPKVRSLLPIASRKAMHGVVGFAWLQVILGISTLLYLVPLPLASAHQAGSLALLSYVLVLGSRSWLPSRRISQMLARRFAVGANSPTHPPASIPRISSLKNPLGNKASPSMR